jgi:hypothetical protein
MSYIDQLYNTYHTAKQHMFEARNKDDRAKWMNMYRWATEEIRRYSAGTVSA